VVPIVLFLFLLLLPQCAVAGLANQLDGHPSPYLAMHGADPVQWQEWGSQTLQRARAENKLVFVSSGYFACHWCHVMQEESYRDKSIAALLNANFIPVKIDRELLPALDGYLIQFVENTRGSAGWPLNVFLTPEGYPLLGLTYAPPETFQRLLVRLSGAWKTQGDELVAMARKASAELAKIHAVKTPKRPAAPAPLLDKFKTQALSIGDELQGGFGRQTRFPMAPQLSVLLEILARKPDRRLADFLTLTLNQMANQGLRDLLAGGFFRYTVDPDWQTPHFEKMLYNQALHIPLYLRAAEVLEIPAYRAVARDTLDFVLHHMAGADGGFISSLSALDEDGVEGGSYLWTSGQLEKLLDAKERRLAGLVWGLQGTPNNDGGYLPVVSTPLVEAARRLELAPEEARILLDRIQAKLILGRASRGLPRDPKPVAAWNGLMLSALAAGVQAFGDDYRPVADRLRKFLETRLWDGDQLYRSVGDGGWIGESALEDYVFVARGLTDWTAAGASGDNNKLALRLVGMAWMRFYKDGWRHSQTSLIPGVPSEPAVPDSPLPSASAMLIGLTLELAVEEHDSALRKQALKALQRGYSVAEEQPFGYAGTVWTLQLWRGGNS
jgi:uncharacterized protein YyaL (SSP411 family)